MKGISFEYSAWYLLAALALGLAYALILYFRDRTFKEQSPAFTWGLAAVRTLAVSLLALLLLGPILRSLQTRSEKPVVVIAQDGSESLAAAWSATDSSAYVTSLQQLRDELAADYDVVSYTFGDAIRDTLDFAFRDKRTNLTALLREVYDLYSNQNLGAVIVGSDGIYNEGANPIYADIKLNAPVYTIGLGDTTRQKDVLIKRVFHNKIAYLGDQFSIQVDLSAQNAAGATVPLRITRLENGQRRVLLNESVTIDRNDFFATREFILDADRAGVNRYRITLGTVPDEQSTANNSRDIFVDVLEARQQILLLAHAPHPDLSALKQSMEQGRNNEVEVAYLNSFTGNIRDYDLVVLHQVPNRRGDANAITATLAESQIPTWYILSESSDFGRLNELQTLLSIQSNGRNTNEVQAQLAPDFSLFKVPEDLRELLPKLPPLLAPFGEFQSGGSGSVLFYQRIGRIDTEYPLFALGELQGTRTAVLAGTGLWQWRLFDYLEKQNHERFNELISQLVQYLSVKDDKRRFRVSLAKNVFDENEPVVLDAELYNDNYELINEPSATLVITDEDGREYNYTFNTTGNGYRLSAGILPVGNYRFRAETNTGTESLNYSGQFSVQAIQLERYELTADHDLLRLLSERYGGALLAPAAVGSLPEQLAARGSVKPVLYQTVTTRSAINLKWIFFLLLGLLSLEWFLRRYFGAY